jgi:hypothetical protein
MPCDTIQTSEVDLKNPNMSILMQALHNKGLNPRLSSDGQSIAFTGGTFKNGVIETRGNLEASEIKIAYSEQIVNYAAKQFGWKVEVDKTAKLRPGVAMVLKAKKS